MGGDERKALDNFMLYGGMPRILSMQDDNDKKTYLSTLYKELYMKDIVERNKVEREDILNDILDFLASQVGSLTNPTNIANALTSMKKEKVNPATVAMNDKTVFTWLIEATSSGLLRVERKIKSESDMKPNAAEII